MNALDIIESAAERTGYRRGDILRDYSFADVLGPSGVTRTVSIAAFTQNPPSYRSAAFAAVSAIEGSTTDWVYAHRALGAPLLFVVDGDSVSLWQVRGNVPPRVLTKLHIDKLPNLFAENRTAWRPESIHRAKAIGQINPAYQLDFVDAGLIPAVEGEISTKLNRLIVDALKKATPTDTGKAPSTRYLFRILFRLLAAKVLQDRNHTLSRAWDASDIYSVLGTIESFYSLPDLFSSSQRRQSSTLSAAWDCLRNGINFCNISSEDLALVYENTLVTPTTRKHFGTHSTPRALAEYAVSRLGFEKFDLSDLRIYEPFAGGATFLVTALRYLREVLPSGLTDQQRHEYLTSRLIADEIDSFAREVAILSLILADYPNKNGWNIREADLFAEHVLERNMRNHNVVLCNPPFGDFTTKEREVYPLANTTYSKPIAALNAALSATPSAIAFVLPQSFISNKKFLVQRQRIERTYRDVELVDLPSGIFRTSDIESSLFLGTDVRVDGSVRGTISLRSTVVAKSDCALFLRTKQPTETRLRVRSIEKRRSGNLWIRPLRDLWQYLEGSEKLSSFFDVHRGIEWTSRQGEAWSRQRRKGYRKGGHNARRLQQYALAESVWLDCRAENLRGRAIALPWEAPKIVSNAVVVSRGPWRIAAAVDQEGLVYSQQFLGFWPRGTMSHQQLLTFIAILNGPIANAFLATHSPARGMRIADIKTIPIPNVLPLHVGEKVSEFIEKINSNRLLSDDDHIVELLTHIDAIVLDAYDLPLALERKLLTYFRDANRPIAYRWKHWDTTVPAHGLSLAERLFGGFRPRAGWIGSVFQPLPKEEADLLWSYGE